MLALASHVLMPVLFALHLSRANDQLFRILVALQLLLLYFRCAYFFRGTRQLGAMMDMMRKVGAAVKCSGLAWPGVKPPCSVHDPALAIAVHDADGWQCRWRPTIAQVILDARWFMLVVLLIVGGAALVFNTLLADSSMKLGESAETENTFGMMDRTMMQLFSYVLGGVDYDSLNSVRTSSGAFVRLWPAGVLACCQVAAAWVYTVTAPHTCPGADLCSPAPLAAVAASRVELVLLAVFCVLTVIVVINMLIAIVSTTFKAVKRQEEAHMLRNYARIIDEIEGSMSE
jgi:hypothetical protein